MKIFFYKECNFRLEACVKYDCKSIIDFFDKNHLNPDEYIIGGADGIEHEYSYDLPDGDYVVYPKIAKGSKGKGWLGVVLGIVTLGLAAPIGGLLGLTIGATKALGIGMLLSGAGTLILGNQKLPSMDINSDSATKQNYQWNVGNLSTSRGVKGVTFGSDVIPEGELLAYRTYGTSSITGGTSTTRYYYGKKEISREQYLKNKKTTYGSYASLSRAETTHTDAYANDDGKSWLEMLIGCGEGELDSISEIKVNDTPINNIEGADYIVRLGTNNQDSLPDTDIDNQIDLMSVGQTMPMKLAGSDAPLIITTSEACDSVLIACQSNAIYNMDQQSGSKNRCYVKPKIGYRLSGSTGAYTYVNSGIAEFDNDMPFKADSAFYFDVAIAFPTNGVYEITLQNISSEKNVQKGLLDSLPSVMPDRLQCNISIDNIALFNNRPQTFPGTALIYLRLPASQALSGSMPKVTWKQSRASCYVWNGARYVTKPLNNLAWAIYDILAQIKKDNYDNSYHNEGEDVNNLDFAKFSEFATFCQVKGITGNWFLNKLDTAWSTAMSVATSARAFIGTRNGKIAPYWDDAADMTQIFTVGNYENLSGSVNAKKDRARAIEATFNDEDDDYNSKTIRVEVDDFSADAEAVGISYVGLSTVDAVYKAAHYQLRKNKYLCQSVKFTANLDALVCELNDIIGIQCDITKYGVGGRIYGVDGNSVSLDAPVTLSGGNYALLVAHDNGTVERMQINEHTGTLTTVTVSSYERAPKANEIYSLGVVNNEVKKYRVTNIVKTSELKCEIEAVEYQPQVYVEGTAPDISYVNPNAGINNITTTYMPEGAQIAWHKNVSTAYVDVYVDGVYYGRYAEGADIPNVNSTQHIELVPYNYGGQSGTHVERILDNNIPIPPAPPMPDILYIAAGYILTFKNLPLDAYLSYVVIYENGLEVAREYVYGNTCVVNLALAGGIHYVDACLVNSYAKESVQRSIVLSPPQIAGWTIEYDQISSTNMQIKAEGSIQTADFVSGHNGWCLDKYGKAEFQDATIRGTMTSVNFVKDTVSAVGGSLMILGSAEVQEFVKTTQNTQNILCEDFIDLTTEDGSTLAMEQSGTSVYYEITLDDASTFSNGDILRIRNAETVQDLWLGVVSKASNIINCVMLYGTAIELESGMCVVNYRRAGNGGILLNGNVPLMDMFTHSGRPWEGTDCWVRMGNIKGINSITDDRFGIFVGDSNGSHSGRHYMQYDEKSGKLQIQGEVLITSGATYNNISNAISAASTAQTTANTAQTTANTAQTTANTANTNANAANINANAALEFRNAVANTNYTSIKGGAITTGIIKSGNYRYVSGDYAEAGTAIDLDNGIFRSVGIKLGDSDGVKIRAGLLNGIDIASIITAIDSSCAAKTVTATYGGSSAAFKGVRGYCKLSNGIMAEWDIVPITWHSTSSSSGYAPDDVVVTLPVSITNGSYLIILQTKCTNGNSVAFWYSTYNQTSTGFAVSIVGRSGAGPSVLEYMIIALAT